MIVKRSLTFLEKLEALGEAARLDLACGSCGEGRVRDSDMEQWIYPAVLPDGSTQKLLKVLMSNSCKYNCAYCAFRSGRDSEKLELDAEQLAGFFNRLLKTGKVSGLFLSSAVNGRPSDVMDRMIKTAEIVRERYNFKGYLHLKLLQGVESDQIVRAMQLAERVSVNFETVSDEHLKKIAPCKKLEGGLWDVLEKASELNSENPRSYRCRGMTTQLVVGAAGETDSEIVGFANNCYNDLRLKRVYYSAYNPIEGTPLESMPPTPLWRENRLYQADFLIRCYGFEPDEFIFNGGNFLAETDPKTAWAVAHPERFPVEVNTANIEQLLRVPGIGPIGAKRIVKARKEYAIVELAQLKKMGVRSDAAAPFVTLKGKLRYDAPTRQLSLPFEAEQIA